MTAVPGSVGGVFVHPAVVAGAAIDCRAAAADEDAAPPPESVPPHPANAAPSATVELNTTGTSRNRLPCTPPP
ncbi:hypothetical protein GCM10009648_11400 [Tsukamurella spumae]